MPTNDKSFSGCDIIATVASKQVTFKRDPRTREGSTSIINSVFELGLLTTISYSIHTDKRPILFCGDHKPRSFVSGVQTIAGTMIFSVMNNHPLYTLMAGKEHGESDTTINDFLQGSNDLSLLPPFDLTLLIGNEHGSSSILNIFDIEFIDEGFTASVNDVYCELTVQYLCRDVSVLTQWENFTKKEAAKYLLREMGNTTEEALRLANNL